MSMHRNQIVELVSIIHLYMALRNQTQVISFCSESFTTEPSGQPQEVRFFCIFCVPLSSNIVNRVQRRATSARKLSSPLTVFPDSSHTFILFSLYWQTCAMG